MTGSLIVWLALSHQLTYTLLPEAAIDALSETTPEELLKLIIGPNVRRNTGTKDNIHISWDASSQEKGSKGD
jgi:hypothetical protein